jgi:hypothetical protein
MAGSSDYQRKTAGRLPGKRTDRKLLALKVIFIRSERTPLSNRPVPTREIDKFGLVFESVKSGPCSRLRVI